MMSRGIVQVYIEDCLVDRLWTDLESSKLLVDNINTLFQPTTIAQEQGGEGIAGGAMPAGIPPSKPHPPVSESETAAPPVAPKSDPAHIPLDGIKVEQR